MFFVSGEKIICAWYIYTTMEALPDQVKFKIKLRHGGTAWQGEKKAPCCYSYTHTRPVDTVCGAYAPKLCTHCTEITHI